MKTGTGLEGRPGEKAPCGGKQAFLVRSSFCNDLRRCQGKATGAAALFLLFLLFRHLHGLVAFSICCISEQQQQMNLGDWR
jgi:hypothetical protein